MNQSGLLELDLSNNQISGAIPNWIWNVSGGDQVYMNLSCNLLVGFQPEFSIPVIDFLDLHSNQLQGEIPIPESANYLDYSRNSFSSSIPAEIGNKIACVNFLSLSDNMLSGPIPPSICNGFTLYVLDLSNNKFSGIIPKCLIDASIIYLAVLNLHNNNLTGTGKTYTLGRLGKDDASESGIMNAISYVQECDLICAISSVREANEKQMCNVECALDGSNFVEENGEWEDDFGT
ncbi:hypothetical protein Vadar_004301 [Vaccinium darrowii]|uniref:Uncharacterized protein n=1 Tax=Vaccinium darrowii TaxID=229202 RepID=A0ACB7ZIB4_9ERIC|nr:hypothetical protein Vadar_004301 [Vaccinium darrowii]